jgi:hypothetical protein
VARIDCISFASCSWSVTRSGAAIRGREVGCETDDEIAAEVMRQNGWEHREQEFRDCARDLVDQHWPEIVAVADELQRTPALDNVEVELIADAAAGLGAAMSGDLATALARYRALRSVRVAQDA